MHQMISVSTVGLWKLGPFLDAHKREFLISYWKPGEKCSQHEVVTVTFAKPVSSEHIDRLLQEARAAGAPVIVDYWQGH